MGRQTETQAGVDIDTGRQTRRRKAGRHTDRRTGRQRYRHRQAGTQTQVGRHKRQAARQAEI